MGYTTDFWGSVTVEPPLNDAEREYIKKFGDTRRMNRTKGPYYVDNAGYAGQDHEDDVLDYNRPPAGQPGLWCQWVPTADGSEIEWDGSEKFYYSPEWMQYLIDHFIKPDAEASKTDDPQFKDFTFDHVVNGVIDAQGEEAGDRWRLIVKDNVVSVQEGEFEFIDPPKPVSIESGETKELNA